MLNNIGSSIPFNFSPVASAGSQGTDNIAGLLSAVNTQTLGSSAILAPNGRDFGDVNTNIVAGLLQQADGFKINSGLTPIQQTLQQLNTTRKSGGITANTPLSFNINDVPLLPNGQPDPSKLAAIQATLGTSSLSANFFFDPSSNSKIKGRPQVPEGLNGLLGGLLGGAGTINGAGSAAQLGGLGPAILQLLFNAGGGAQQGGAANPFAQLFGVQQPVAPQAPAGGLANILMMFLALFGQGR